MTVETFIIAVVVVFAWISLLTAGYFSTRELYRASRAALRVSRRQENRWSQARQGRRPAVLAAARREAETLLLPVVSRRG